MTRLLYIAGGVAGVFAVFGFWWLVQTFLGDTAFYGALVLLLAVQGGLFGLLAYRSRRRP